MRVDESRKSPTRSCVKLFSITVALLEYATETPTRLFRIELSAMTMPVDSVSTSIPPRLLDKTFPVREMFDDMNIWRPSQFPKKSLAYTNDQVAVSKKMPSVLLENVLWLTFMRADSMARRPKELPTSSARSTQPLLESSRRMPMLL